MPTVTRSHGSTSQPRTSSSLLQRRLAGVPSVGAVGRMPRSERLDRPCPCLTFRGDWSGRRTRRVCLPAWRPHVMATPRVRRIPVQPWVQPAVCAACAPPRRRATSQAAGQSAGRPTGQKSVCTGGRESSLALRWLAGQGKLGTRKQISSDGDLRAAGLIDKATPPSRCFGNFSHTTYRIPRLYVDRGGAAAAGRGGAHSYTAWLPSSPGQTQNAGSLPLIHADTTRRCSAAPDPTAGAP